MRGFPRHGKGCPDYVPVSPLFFFLAQMGEEIKASVYLFFSFFFFFFLFFAGHGEEVCGDVTI